MAWQLRLLGLAPFADFMPSSLLKRTLTRTPPTPRADAMLLLLCTIAYALRLLEPADHELALRQAATRTSSRVLAYATEQSMCSN